MRTRKTTPLTIIQDTREQNPLDFSPFAAEGVTVEVGTCWPGDYAPQGWEKSIAFERKSVSDLIGTLKKGYVGRDSPSRYKSRFDLELEEFERHFDRAFIIVEPDPPNVIRHNGGEPTGCSASMQIARHWYESIIEPEKIWAFLFSLEVTYNCHVYLAESREDAAAQIVAVSRKYIAARRHVIHRGAASAP